jgi:hypothetical protein
LTLAAVTTCGTAPEGADLVEPEVLEHAAVAIAHATSTDNMHATLRTLIRHSLSDARTLLSVGDLVSARG